MLREFDMFWQGFKAKGGECGNDFFVGNGHLVWSGLVGFGWCELQSATQSSARELAVSWGLGS